MLNMSKTPRCAAYLHAMRVKLDDPAMNEYWSALCVAESFSDKALQKFGDVNFHTMSGEALLSRMEQFLEYRSKTNSKPSKAVKVRVPDPLTSITGAISNDEIKSAMSPRGGWSRATLEKWGVPWPHPKGWRERLVRNFKAITC